MKIPALLGITTLMAMNTAWADPQPRKIGSSFIVGYKNGERITEDGLSPNGKLAIVVDTDQNVGVVDGKGDGSESIDVKLINVASGEVLLTEKVGGDFTWGPLTSMITCNWHQEQKGFRLRINAGRMMSETRLYLLTSSGEWKRAVYEKSPFESSKYFQDLHSGVLAAGTAWDKKHSPPNRPSPGFRHFGDWIDGNKIIVWESYGGDLIYKFDDHARLYLIGYDPGSEVVEE